MKISRSRLQAAVIFALCAVPPSSKGAAPDPAMDYPEEREVEAGERWREKLGLDDTQARKFTALENDKEARLKPLREILRNAMVDLQTLLAENGREADVQDLLKRILETRAVIAERAAEFDAKRAAFLTPAQHARLIVWESMGGLDGYAARRLEAAARREPPAEEPHEKE